MFLDSHVHLDDQRFHGELPGVIERAVQAGVTTMINAGSDLESSRQSIGLAGEYPGIIYAAAGIHPHEASGVTDSTLTELRVLLGSSGAVALGEIGLDYFYDYSPRDVQQRAFGAQLDLAEELGLPVIIHMREATADAMAILNHRRGRLAGVMHCFSGSWETARELLDGGFFLGFNGPLTFPRSDRLREIAAQAPLDRILIETDCPYLTPEPFRGRRNEPAYVVHVAEALAKVKGISVEEIGRQTANNARGLFGLL